ncbi:hypothetical protein HPG69_012592 [Diceros bicornis minor]|uniref:Uncharacterized protein n=1 Tax=Diceros bicornis minor TaxID=77932 RepID=A0A7J7F8V0_DICBM|nr:hypothetical protein HPG69_012592 [Diceros bicornis minor]
MEIFNATIVATAAATATVVGSRLEDKTEATSDISSTQPACFFSLFAARTAVTLPLATFPLQILDATKLAVTDLIGLSVGPTSHTDHEMRCTISNSPSFAVPAVSHFKFQPILGVPLNMRIETLCIPVPWSQRQDLLLLLPHLLAPHPSPYSLPSVELSHLHLCMWILLPFLNRILESLSPVSLSSPASSSLLLQSFPPAQSARLQTGSPRCFGLWSPLGSGVSSLPFDQAHPMCSRYPLKRSQSPPAHLLLWSAAVPELSTFPLEQEPPFSQNLGASMGSNGEPLSPMPLSFLAHLPLILHLLSSCLLLTALTTLSLWETWQHKQYTAAEEPNSSTAQSAFGSLTTPCSNFGTTVSIQAAFGGTSVVLLIGTDTNMHSTEDSCSPFANTTPDPFGFMGFSAPVGSGSFGVIVYVPGPSTMFGTLSFGARTSGTLGTTAHVGRGSDLSTRVLACSSAALAWARQAAVSPWDTFVTCPDFFGVRSIGSPAHSFSSTERNNVLATMRLVRSQHTGLEKFHCEKKKEINLGKSSPPIHNSAREDGCGI